MILLAVLALVYGTFCLLLYLNQEKLIYFPDQTVLLTPNSVGLEYREHWIETTDGERLHAWWLPSTRVNAPVILFFHGNAGNISHRLESLRLFHELGLSTLIIDYRGYGLSSGRPSEAGTYHDAQAAYDFLQTHHNVAAQRLIIFGRSLGGGVATWLASHNACTGAIIESSFLSIPTMGQEIYPWMPIQWLSRIHYDNADRMTNLNCPVLVIHSRDDELIPFRHGQQLHALGAGPKHFLEISGSHNSGFMASKEHYRNGLGAFFKTLNLSSQIL
jgi:fermentation-respiration switch protein FrsA (DUF1100 family)